MNFCSLRLFVCLSWFLNTKTEEVRRERKEKSLTVVVQTVAVVVGGGQAFLNNSLVRHDPKRLEWSRQGNKKGCPRWSLFGRVIATSDGRAVFNSSGNRHLVDPYQFSCTSLLRARHLTGREEVRDGAGGGPREDRTKGKRRMMAEIMDE